MQKRLLILTAKYLLTASRVKTWKYVQKNNWWIKFSIYNNSKILLCITSKNTGQTIVRYFSNEDLACSFLNLILALDPNIYHETVE
jgi:hypothetical protein